MPFVRAGYADEGGSLLEKAVSGMPSAGTLESILALPPEVAHSSLAIIKRTEMQDAAETALDPQLPLLLQLPPTEEKEPALAD